MNRRTQIASLLQDLDLRSPAGFAIALHIRFTAPTYMFQTYAKRWLDTYSSEGLVLHDPVARWGLQNIGRVRWSELEAMDGGGVMERAKDFGLMNGVAIALVLEGSRSIAGFSRADREYDDVEIAEMEDRVADLHRMTGGPDQLSPTDQRALTALSVRLTHV